MIGKKIGRYELLTLIGQGRMATVYQAQDTQVQRRVAVKIFNDEINRNGAMRTRLLREAALISSLEHSAIVPIYDFGEFEGKIFVVMRYMSGGSLEQFLGSGNFSVVETEGILDRICSASDFAHHRRVIHGSLNPSNILFDQQGNAFISDFAFGRMGLESGLLWQNMGGRHVAYMSPEQRQNHVLFSPESDIYSLGIILFKMLTGLLPQEAHSLAGQSVAPDTTILPNVRAIRPDLPNGVELVVEKATRLEPATRYSSAGMLSADFSGALQRAKNERAQVGAGRISESGGSRREDAELLLPLGVPTQSPDDSNRDNPLWKGVQAVLLALFAVGILLAGIFLVFRQALQPAPGVTKTAPPEDSLKTATEISNQLLTPETESVVRIPSSTPKPGETQYVVGTVQTLQSGSASPLPVLTLTLSGSTPIKPSLTLSAQVITSTALAVNATETNKALTATKSASPTSLPQPSNTSVPTLAPTATIPASQTPLPTPTAVPPTPIPPTVAPTDTLVPIPPTLTDVVIVLPTVVPTQPAVVVVTDNPFDDATRQVLANSLYSKLNNMRAQYGRSGLSLSNSLINAAQLRANDMANRNFFGHTDPSTGRTLILDYLSPSTYGTMAETLFISSYEPDQNTVAQWVAEQWQSSGSYFGFITDTRHSYLGIGIALDSNCNLPEADASGRCWFVTAVYTQNPGP